MLDLHETVDKSFIRSPSYAPFRGIKCSLKGHNMSEPEYPFKSLKITLSEEALARLDEIVKKSSFRSYSSGVEECIRVVYDVMAEVHSVIGQPHAPLTTPTIDEEIEGFKRISMRMSRFTGRHLVPESTESSGSAGR